MTGPAVAEVSHDQEVSLFHVEAMTDDELIVTYRALRAFSDQANDTEADSFVQMEVGDRLHERFASEVQSLAARDPERMTALVKRLTTSQLDLDQQLAVSTVSGLLDHDYGFTRNTLVSLYVGIDVRMNASGDRGYASNMAQNEIQTLISDRLTHEQAVDFIDQVHQFDPDAMFVVPDDQPDLRQSGS